MSFQGNVLYSPYGAAELKATYQRNLALGSLTAVSLVLTTLGVFWLTGLFAGTTIPLVEPSSVIEIRHKLPPPPTFETQQLQTAKVDVKALLDKLGVPTPVPDDEYPFDEAAIVTREEMKEITEWDGGRGPGDGDSVIYRVDSALYEPPKRTDFIKCEIYPKMVYEAAPEYPRLADMAGIEGAVWVQALLDTLGNVREAVVARTSGTAALDEAAVRAAYKNKFTPGIQNGRPVLVWVTYKVEFVLDR